MSTDTLRAKAVDILFTSLASSPYSTLPVRVENKAFSQPKNGPWLSFYIMPVDAARASIGTDNKYQKHDDLIVVEVYVPENSGTKTLHEIMDFVGDALEESRYALTDGDNVSTKTAKKKTNGLQYGAYRGTVLVHATRRTCKP